jgi:polyferredoxin
MNAALPSPPLAALLADAVLLAHLGVVVFNVGGLVLIVAGNRLGWRWVNRGWFRAAHLAAIAVVVAQAWLGITCPLTTLESWLRALSGTAPYGEGFIQHWVQRILFYQAPAWVFALAYTLFGLLVAAVWWRYPPQRGKPAP